MSFLHRQRLIASFTLVSYLLAALAAGPLHQWMHHGHQHMALATGADTVGLLATDSDCHQHHHHDGVAHKHDHALADQAERMESARGAADQRAFQSASARHDHDHACAICALLSQSQITAERPLSLQRALPFERVVAPRNDQHDSCRIFSFQSRGPPAQA